MIEGHGYKQFSFPCGELHLVIAPVLPNHEGQRVVDVTWTFRGSDDIVELMLFGDAVRREGARIRQLIIPYFPFARQDRVNQSGEPLSVAVMADVVNRLEAEQVIVTDPHSDVVPALVKNCRVREQWQALAPQILDRMKKKDKYYLVSPDAGAMKKILKLAQRVHPHGVVECSKVRDVRTGEIVETVVHAVKLNRLTCVIVDDICDGGRTFVEIAKVLKRRGAGVILLMVTHGFFTKGLGVFDGLIDEVYTRQGRVK